MRVRIFTVFFAFLCFSLSVNAVEKWSIEKAAGALTVCYQASSSVYCAGSTNKKAGETDLKNYLSAFLQFAGYEVNKTDMILHPGIIRLIKSSRPEQSDRVLKGVFDYLVRERKRFSISIFSGADKNSQNIISETDTVNIIESVNWPKYIDSSLESITCTTDQKINLNFKIKNSMKTGFFFYEDESEIRVLGGRGDILSVGSISTEHKKIEVKAGETADYNISIIFTGEMDQSTRYSIVPFIKNIQISKEEAFVLCKQAQAE